MPEKKATLNYEKGRSFKYDIIIGLNPVQAQIIYKAAFTLVDFVMFLGTLIAIWFGFSVLSLNDLYPYLLKSESKLTTSMQSRTEVRKSKKSKKFIKCKSGKEAPTNDHGESLIVQHARIVRIHLGASACFPQS